MRNPGQNQISSAQFVVPTICPVLGSLMVTKCILISVVELCLTCVGIQVCFCKLSLFYANIFYVFETKYALYKGKLATFKSFQRKWAKSIFYRLLYIIQHFSSDYNMVIKVHV